MVRTSIWNDGLEVAVTGGDDLVPAGPLRGRPRELSLVHHPAPPGSANGSPSRTTFHPAPTNAVAAQHL